MKDLKDITKEDIFAALGLQPTKTTVDYILPALGVFGAGILVGVGVGMLVAPKPGRQLREEISNKVSSRLGDRVTEEASAH